jgi:two-component system, LuxR family, response regulator FixJ
MMEINGTARPVFLPTLGARPAVLRKGGRGIDEFGPRVFVVNDEESVRKSVADLLATEDYSVEFFAGAAEFLARVPHPGPGCIVLELLRGFDGLAFQGHLTKEGRAERIVFIGAHADVRLGIEAVKRGAVDFLPKPFGDDELLSAVVQALARSGQVVESRMRLAKLTPREFEVFRWIVAGLINKEISEELGVTLRTVKAHRASVMRKIGVPSVLEMARLALLADVSPAQPGIVQGASGANREIALTTY